MHLPRWKCHKEVEAVKIDYLTHQESGIWIVPATPGVTAFTVSAQYIERHRPHSGGYYVRYRDGYESFSPAEAFESGYTRL